MDKDSILSPETLEDTVILRVLQKAGWFLGRRVDTSPYREFGKKYPCELFDLADSILREFGGLELRVPNVFGSPLGIESIVFDPLVSEEEPARWWQKKLNRPFYPLGECDYETWLVDKAGCIYLNRTPAILLGDNLSMALDTMIHKRRTFTVLDNICYRDYEKMAWLTEQRKILSPEAFAELLEQERRQEEAELQ